VFKNVRDDLQQVGFLARPPLMRTWSIRSTGAFHQFKAVPWPKRNPSEEARVIHQGISHGDATKPPRASGSGFGVRSGQVGHDNIPGCRREIARLRYYFIELIFL
jgi:hypothetical protein